MLTSASPLPMIVRHLACTEEECTLVRTHPRLADLDFEAIHLPITGTADPIELLIVGTGIEDRTNLAVTVSDWNWPPVTIFLLPADAPDTVRRMLLSHPRIGRGIFACRSVAGGALQATVDEALAFVDERKLWYSQRSESRSFTINNISPRWLFESMMRSLDEYIYFKDADSRFLAVSQYLVDQCGRSGPEEILGRTDEEFFDSNHAQEAYADERRIAIGELTELHKEENLEEDGQERWVLSHKFPLLTRSNYLAGSFGISRDITEPKRLQQGMEASNARMEAELKLAKNLQKTLMGRRLPVFSRGPQNDPLAIAAKYLPSYHLSGDFYACRRTPSGAAAFLVADVVGHGVRAAMITAMIQIAVQQLHHLSDQPDKFMEALNAMIHQSVKPLKEPIFATAIYARLDTKRLHLQYIQAGARHGALIQAEPKRNVSALPSERIGPALGLLPESSYQISECQMASGDSLFAYTDGLIEACNPEGEEFGEARLLDWLAGLDGGDWETVFDRLIEELAQFTQKVELDDDLCLLACHVP